MRSRCWQERGCNGAYRVRSFPTTLSLNLSRRCPQIGEFVACKRPINDRLEDL
jgi:hypothetical protein